MSSFRTLVLVALCAPLFALAADLPPDLEPLPEPPPPPAGFAAAGVKLLVLPPVGFAGGREKHSASSSPSSESAPTPWNAVPRTSDRICSTV